MTPWKMLVLASLVSAPGACRKSSEDQGDKRRARGEAVAPQSTEELSQPLARVDDTVITVKQLQDSINRQSPYIRARYQSREQKRVFLDNLIKFEVLAKEAARRGLDKDPEVVQTMKSAMIGKLMRGELQGGLKPEDVPEADMKAYFEAHKAEFDKPEEVRVSAVILKKNRQADEVARLAKAPEGQSNKAFRDLVSKYSTDEDTKLRGGDLRFFTRDSPDLPREVIEAAFALGKTGDVAGPVQAGSTFYVLKQTGRRKAVTKSYDQVKRQIQNDLYKTRRDDMQKKFVEDLKTRAKIQVYEDNLKKVRVDSSGRAATDPPASTDDVSPAPLPPAGGGVGVAP